MPTIRLATSPSVTFPVLAAVVLAGALMALMALMGVPTATIAHADPQVDTSAQGDAGKNLDMGIHYVLVAKPDLAASNLQAVLDAVVEDAALAELVSVRGLDQRLEDAIRRGRLLPGVGEVIVLLDARVDAGRLALARDQVRIDAAVAALDGTGRQQVLAQERLLAAGEYAIPALLRAALDTSKPSLSVSARSMLVREGRMAVAPLCAVLGGEADADTQKFAAQVLGEIAWPAAEPFLLNLANDESFPGDVRQAASTAYGRCGGGAGTVAEQFGQLARQYFDAVPSVVPYPRDAVNTIWNYDRAAGLEGQSVPTPVFGSMMAKQLAARALGIDPSSEGALVTYVAADLRSENRAPADFEMADGGRGADFYARLAGMNTAAGVLDLALRSGDAPLALDALDAISHIGGSATIVAQQPSSLSRALVFGDRRVQFEAALVLAAANPRTSFQNASLVVARIASMLQTNAGPVGAVVAAEEEAQAIASDLAAGGFEPGAYAPGIGQLAANIDSFGGTIDFIVLQGSRSFIERELGALRETAAFNATPILMLADVSELAAVDSAAGSDIRCLVATAGTGSDALGASLAALLAKAAGGGFTSEEAAAARDRAFAALQELGTRSAGQFSIVDARRDLIAAARSPDELLATQAAPVLALVPDPSAQAVLFDQAMARQGDARIAFLYAVADNARRMGTFLDPKRVEAMLELVQMSTGDEGVAAGAAYGALNLPSAEAVQLITR